MCNVPEHDNCHFCLNHQCIEGENCIFFLAHAPACSYLLVQVALAMQTVLIFTPNVEEEGLPTHVVALKTLIAR